MSALSVKGGSPASLPELCGGQRYEGNVMGGYKEPKRGDKGS